MRGFVERVGDRTPLVAADGTKYLGDALTVEALEAMARAVDYGTPVTIAVPAYWSPEQSDALREEFFAQPGLAPNGVPPALVSDATAALTALRAEPDFPTEGIVALCDFGASGTTVTLTDAGSDFAQIGPSVRYREFSGDAIDQLILDRVRDSAPSDSSGGLASTTRMGSLARLLDRCRTREGKFVDGDGHHGPDGYRRGCRAVPQRIRGADLRAAGRIRRTRRRDTCSATRFRGRTWPRWPPSAAVPVIPLLGARLSERLEAPVRTTATRFERRDRRGRLRPAAPLGPRGGGESLRREPDAIGQRRPADMTQVMPGARIEEEGPWPGRRTKTRTSRSPTPAPSTAANTSGTQWDFDDADDEAYAAGAGRLPWYKRTA